MRRFLTVTASTKRAPAVSGGKRGTPAAHLAGVACTPLDPVDAELRQRLQLNTPHELLQSFVDGGLDIREGDWLVVAGEEYPIRDVEEWAWGRGLRGAYLRLVLENLKR